MLNTELIRCLSVAYDLAKEPATRNQLNDLIAQECMPAGNGLLTLAEMREIANGKKIGAIKLYRTRTGAPLKDAKEVVEAFLQLMVEWKQQTAVN